MENNNDSFNFNLLQSVKIETISWSFTSIAFLTKWQYKKAEKVRV